MRCGTDSYTNFAEANHCVSAYHSAIGSEAGNRMFVEQSWILTVDWIRSSRNRQAPIVFTFRVTSIRCIWCDIVALTWEPQPPDVMMCLQNVPSWQQRSDARNTVLSMDWYMLDRNLLMVVRGIEVSASHQYEGLLSKLLSDIDWNHILRFWTVGVWRNASRYTSSGRYAIYGSDFQACMHLSNTTI